VASGWSGKFSSGTVTEEGGHDDIRRGPHEEIGHRIELPKEGWEGGWKCEEKKFAYSSGDREVLMGNCIFLEKSRSLPGRGGTGLILRGLQQAGTRPFSKGKSASKGGGGNMG